MKKINALTLMTCAAMAFATFTSAPGFADDDKMMMKHESMAMEKTDAMMEKMDMTNEVSFTPEAFSMAQASGKPFLVAFHKKGCPMCAEQKQALNMIYADPAYKGLKVLVVDYINDTTSLKKFNVGAQGALILYKGKNEVSRTAGLVKAVDIKKQIEG